MVSFLTVVTTMDSIKDGTGEPSSLKRNAVPGKPPACLSSGGMAGTQVREQEGARTHTHTHTVAERREVRDTRDSFWVLPKCEVSSFAQACGAGRTDKGCRLHIPGSSVATVWIRSGVMSSTREPMWAQT